MIRNISITLLALTLTGCTSNYTVPAGGVHPIAAQ